MKNFRIVAVLFITILFSACQEETLVTSEPTAENEELATLDKQQELGRWKYCFPIIEQGRWIFNPSSGSFFCNSNLIGICSIRWICIVPPILVDPCGFVPCWEKWIDPWEIYRELDPRKFGSFRDKLDFDIDPEINVAPFKINEQTIGLQFYAPIKEVLDEEVLVLESDLDLGEEFAKQYGVRGSVVPAGKYPVVFNPENKTFNAIVTLGK